MNHDWILDACRCADDRALVALLKGDDDRVERELETAFRLQPILFLLNSFRRLR
ncbi:MAG: hypothetical protein VKI63_00150 [Cyanobium sp.]|nr:hypothetical protein [Cyanobium sp.]